MFKRNERKNQGIAMLEKENCCERLRFNSDAEKFQLMLAQ